MKPKLIAAFLLFGLVPYIAIGVTTLNQASSEFEAQAFDKLTAVREIKKNSIERYFSTIRDQVVTLSQDTMVIEAMAEFNDTVKTFRVENDLSDEQIASMTSELKTYYTGQFAPEFEKQNSGAKPGVDAIFSKLDKN